MSGINKTEIRAALKRNLNDIAGLRVEQEKAKSWYYRRNKKTGYETDTDGKKRAWMERKVQEKETMIQVLMKRNDGLKQVLRSNTTLEVASRTGQQLEGLCEKRKAHIEIQDGVIKSLKQELKERAERSLELFEKINQLKKVNATLNETNINLHKENEELKKRNANLQLIHNPLISFDPETQKRTVIGVDMADAAKESLMVFASAVGKGGSYWFRKDDRVSMKLNVKTMEDQILEIAEQITNITPTVCKTEQALKHFPLKQERRPRPRVHLFDSIKPILKFEAPEAMPYKLATDNIRPNETVLAKKQYKSSRKKKKEWQ